MSAREVEGNCFIIGVKPVGSDGGTGSFKGVKRFPSGFDFVIAFSINKELAFLAIDPILENFFNLPFLLSRGIHAKSFFGGGFREFWEGFKIWSKIYSKMAAMDPRVNALHDGREVEFVVIVLLRAFKDRQRS